MIWILLGCAAVLVATSLLSALNLALMQASESALQRRLDDAGRSAAGQWLFERWAQVDHAVSFLRTWGRVGFYALVMMGMSLQPDGTFLVTGGLVLEALLVSAVLLWIFTSVVSGALARYAAVDLLAAVLPLLRVIDALLRPVTALGQVVDEAVRRLTGANLRPEEAQEELLRRIEDTQRQGGLDAASAAMLENVVEFRDTEVSAVMTPRTDIEGLELTNDLALIRGVIRAEGHSRIPVYEGSLDSIVGVLYVKDLVGFLGEDPSKFTLAPILRQPIRVPEAKKVRDLLLDFQRNKVHMAIVIDEYGGTAGLVTIEDVLEEIVGEIQDEHEGTSVAPPPVTELSEGVVEVEGRFPLRELAGMLDAALPEDLPYETVAGHVLATVGRMPEPGTVAEADGLRFTVVASSRTAVTRVRVERIPEPGSRDQEA